MSVATATGLAMLVGGMSRGVQTGAVVVFAVASWPLIKLNAWALERAVGTRVSPVANRVALAVWLAFCIVILVYIWS